MENTIENALKFVLSSDHSIRMAYIHSLGAGDWDKLSDLLHSYASQTAPKLVLPSEETIYQMYPMVLGDRYQQENNAAYREVFRNVISLICRLNPHITDPGYTDPK